MDRSVYPTKVEVRSADLENTELTKAEAILQRLIDSGQPGIVSGLVLQQSNVGNQRFDLLSGYGYAPNGEMTELDASLLGQSVGTLAAGSAALVGLMYTETSINPGAAETDGVARPRQIIRGSNLRVFTADQFNALPATFPQDLTQDAQDRFLVCGIAVIPLTTASPLSITVPPTFSLIKTIPQPSNVTGTVITNISPATKNSNPFPADGTPDLAILLYAPSTTQMAYRSPFDIVNLGNPAPFNVLGLGNPVNVGAGGTFTLTSANGLDTIQVVVDPNLLPSATASPSTQDNLDVETVYGGPVQRFSAKDDQHRHLVGSRVPTAKDPHGVRFQDIATLLESLIGTLTLGTGYLSNLIQAEVPRLIFPPNTQVDAGGGSKVFQALIDAPGASHVFGPANVPMHIRLYRSGFDSLVILLNCKVRNSGANATFERLAANGDNINAQSAMIELSPFAVVFYARDATSGDTWDFTQWDRVQLFHSFSSNTTTLDGTVTIGSGTAPLTDPVGALTPRIDNKYSQVVSRTCMWRSIGNFIPGAGIARIYRCSAADALGYSDTFEVSFNASWSNTGNNWTRDSAAATSWLLTTSKSGNLSMLFHAGASGSPWNDSIGGGGWDEASMTMVAGPSGGLTILHSLGVGGTTLLEGAVTALGALTAGSLTSGTFVQAGTNFTYGTPTIATQSIPGAEAIIDPSSNASGVGVPSVDPVSGSALTAASTNPPSAFFNNVGSGNFGALWPIHIPEGATITAAALHGNFHNNAGQLRGAVVRKAKSGGTRITLNGGGGAGTYDTTAGGTDVDFALSVNANNVVFNELFDYFIWLGAGSASTEAAEVWHASVTYSVPQVAYA